MILQQCPSLEKKRNGRRRKFGRKEYGLETGRRHWDVGELQEEGSDGEQRKERVKNQNGVRVLYVLD